MSTATMLLAIVYFALLLNGCTEQKWKHKFLTDPSTKELIRVCKEGPKGQEGMATEEQFQFCMENFGFYKINE